MLSAPTKLSCERKDDRRWQLTPCQDTCLVCVWFISALMCAIFPYLGADNGRTFGARYAAVEHKCPHASSYATLLGHMRRWARGQTFGRTLVDHRSGIVIGDSEHPKNYAIFFDNRWLKGTKNLGFPRCQGGFLKVGPIASSVPTKWKRKE